MRLGIDFGTTRIVVAAADRGNFPLVSFSSGGESFEWFPSLVAFKDALAGDGLQTRELSGSEMLFGWDAWAAQSDPGWTVVRSLKRFLADAGPHTRVDLNGVHLPLLDTVTGLTMALHTALTSHYGKQSFQVMLGIPANANSNQRYLTTEAFRRAGFEVLGLLNEPSAAAIEYGHRHHLQKEDARVLVYDLGGGTFDASLVQVGAAAAESAKPELVKSEPAKPELVREDQPRVNTVLATSGIATLGGDDFDRVLATMAVGAVAIGKLHPAHLFRLEEECRRQKEALHANSRRLVLDLESVLDQALEDAPDEALEGFAEADVASQTVIPVADFYARCRPLLDQTLAVTTALAPSSEIDVLYVTGGGSEMPLVARTLREEYGRKVKRSEYTRSATAIGLAIHANGNSPAKLREVFTRNFGVWREARAGDTPIFDSIFAAGTRLPAPGAGPLVASRSYIAAHNVGHYRYLEAAPNLLTSDPVGDLIEWDVIRFPFDPTLAAHSQLESVPVERTDFEAAQAIPAQEIEERYTCDSSGGISVTIRNATSSYQKTYSLGHWNQKASGLTANLPRKRAAGQHRS